MGMLAFSAQNPCDIECDMHGDVRSFLVVKNSQDLVKKTCASADIFAKIIYEASCTFFAAVSAFQNKLKGYKFYLSQSKCT